MRKTTFFHTLDGRKVPSTHCSTLRVGICICGSTPACSRTMPSPTCCLLDVSWSRVATCNIQWKNKSVNTCSIYSSPFLFLLFALPSSFVSVALCASPLMFETTSFLCVRARVWMASSRDRLPNVCVFNDLVSELIEPCSTWANLHSKITSRSDQTGRKSNKKKKSHSCFHTQIFNWWSWQPFPFVLECFFVF